MGPPFLAVVAVIGVSARLSAASAPPPYSILRYNEDYSYLRDTRKRAEPLDRLKFIPLDEAGDVSVSVGGEARERYEYFSDYNWGAGPQSAGGYWLERYMLHSDWHAGGRFRMFEELESSLETGRSGGPRPVIDQDKLELKQIFADVTPFGKGLTIRPGRQEMSFGSSRLVSSRESPNTHQNFDGVRLMGRSGPWSLDALGMRPMMANPGVWDDHEDYNRTLWGVYGAYGVAPGRAGGIDLYYLRYANSKAKFNQGLGNEVRHTVGTRLWGSPGNTDYNFEFVYQWGRFGSGLIQAWTAASDSGYTAGDFPGSPRFGLRADITSGDRDPKNPGLQTFNALFPKGAYFSEIALIGPYNHMDAHPQIDWHLPKRVKLTVDCDFFWRQSIHDGLYGISGNLLRPAGTSRANYVGTQPAVQAEWQIDRHFSAMANYTRFFVGAFLRESPPAHDINYLLTQAAFKF